MFSEPIRLLPTLSASAGDTSKCEPLAKGEVCFFFRFFWAWGHCAWVPSALVGGAWPPVGVKPISPLGVPLFNLHTLDEKKRASLFNRAKDLWKPLRII